LSTELLVAIIAATTGILTTMVTGWVAISISKANMIGRQVQADTTNMGHAIAQKVVPVLTATHEAVNSTATKQQERIDKLQAALDERRNEDNAMLVREIKTLRDELMGGGGRASYPQYPQPPQQQPPPPSGA
jgi:hypothetical protein